MNSVKELQSNFNNFDRTSKGFLTSDEYSKFAKEVLSSYENGEEVKSGLDEKLKANGKVTYEDYIEVSNGLLETNIELSKAIIRLLKQLKESQTLNDEDRRMIDWGINVILNKEIDRCELSKEISNVPSVNFDMPLVRPSISSTGLNLLKSLDHLDFDIFAYEKAVGRSNVLPSITYQVLKRNNVLSYIDEKAFWTFIKKIQAGYKPNPYHSDIHASDVVQLCNFLLQNGVKEIGKLNDLDVLALIIAAAVHDFRHPGFNNNYMVQTKSDLAALYNDQAVLENFHASEAFKLLWGDKDCDIFVKLTKSERNLLRKRITEAVLSTDNIKHFELLGWLDQTIISNGISKGKNAEKIVAHNESDSKQQLLAICMHLADVSNPARSFEIAKEWGKKVTEEFYLQGDSEKAKGLPLSIGCDRTKGNLPKSQIAFSSVMVKPYVEKVVEIFPKLQIMLDNINNGQEEWGKIEKELESQGLSSN